MKQKAPVTSAHRKRSRSLRERAIDQLREELLSRLSPQFPYRLAATSDPAEVGRIWNEEFSRVFNELKREYEDRK